MNIKQLPRKYVHHETISYGQVFRFSEEPGTLYMRLWTTDDNEFAVDLKDGEIMHKASFNPGSLFIVHGSFVEEEGEK